MFGLALRTLRRHAVGFVATFVALFAGAVIVAACGGLLETGIRIAAPPHRLAAAAVVVTADQSSPEGNGPLHDPARLDASVAARLAALPGVAAAVPDLSFDVAVLPGVSVTGHGWASAVLAPYRLVAGTAPGPGRIVLDAATAARAGIGLGGRIEAVVHGGTESFALSGIAAGPGPAAFLSDSDAARLAPRPGRIDDVGLFPVPGTGTDALVATVSAADPTLSVLTGDERGQAEFPGVLSGGDALIPLSSVFGGLSMLVAIFVVSGTLALTVRQRQRDLALLRAVGAAPGQVRTLIVGEALVVSVLATGLAVLPGHWFGQWLFDRLASAGVVSPAVVYHQGWIPVVSSAGAALLAAVAAALVAAHRAATARPTDALTEAALPTHWLSWPRAVCAALCLGGGVALAIVTATVMNGPVAASTAAPAAMLWAIGLALLGPGLTRVVLAVLRWPARLGTGVAGYLAATNARARRIAVAAAVTPVMLVTGLATAMIYLQTSQDAVGQRLFTEGLRADAVLVSHTGGLPAGFAADLARLPGVAAASADVDTTVYLLGPPPPPDAKPERGTGDATSVAVRGVTPAGAAATTSIVVTAGSLGDLAGDAIALPASVAADAGRAVGDRVPARLGDGTPVTLRIVALVSGPRGYETGFVPADLVAPHTGTGLVSTFLVRAGPGVGGTALAATLAGAARAHPGLAVADRSAVLDAHAAGEGTGAWVNYLLVGTVVGYAVLALVNTLLVAVAGRRREFALHRLVGSTRGQVLRMMGVEAGLVTAGGVVLGTVVAAASLVPFTVALDRSVLPVGPGWIYPAVVGGAAVVTAVSTLVPSWLALRGRAGATV